MKFFHKTVSDTHLNLKADTTTAYTKAETDTLLTNKACSSSVDSYYSKPDSYYFDSLSASSITLKPFLNTYAGTYFYLG